MSDAIPFRRDPEPAPPPLPFTAIGLKISEIAYFSIASVFVISYATGHLGLPRSVILQSVQMSAAVALIAIPTFGWLADNLGRKTMFIASCPSFRSPSPSRCSGCWIPGRFHDRRNADRCSRHRALAKWSASVSAPLGRCSELFPAARLRYSGASHRLPDRSGSLGGGLDANHSGALTAWSGATWPISVYPIACACITLTAALTAAGNGPRGTDLAAAVL